MPLILREVLVEIGEQHGLGRRGCGDGGGDRSEQKGPRTNPNLIGVDIDGRAATRVHLSYLSYYDTHVDHST